MAAKRKAALEQAVEKRTRQRLAARKEAAKKGAETKRRKRGQAAQSAPKPEVASQVAEEQKERPERSVAQNRPPHDPAAMVTVALRGAPAARLRALATKDGLSLSKLLVRMMEVFEAQTG